MSEINETHSTVYVKVLRLFIYLIVWKHGIRGRRIAKGEYKIQRNERYHTDKGESFLWIEAVFENEFCNLQIYLSFFMLSNRIQN